jgi:hypothetical protein
MIVAVVELALLLALLGLLVVAGLSLWRALQGGDARGRLPGRDRAALAAAIGSARWVPGHDEVDGVTRVLLRRTYTGLDGHPAVLEERVLETFPADDAAWEALFTEAMSRARFRCSYLNAEESS